MAYRLNEITVRMNNSPERLGELGEIWRDIMSGKLPLLFDSEGGFQSGISPVSRYGNYALDEKGDYDLTIMGVTAEFFDLLETEVREGRSIKYDVCDPSGDMGLCAKQAWEQVWADKEAKKISRAFTHDYESTVPAEYTKDGKAHCYLYIAVL